MVRMIMHGCGGAMGQVITGLAAEDDSIEIVAGIDLHPSKDIGYPVFNSLDQCNVKADVIVDFSSAKAVDGLLKYCSETGMPVVLCTTGLSKGQLETLKRASASAAVLRSANMSLGVSVLQALVKKAAAVLEGYNIEIVERHHNRKVDAPSGTALMLADAAASARSQPSEYIYDRHSVRQPRGCDEIGISSVRGGTIVGEHEVIFAGRDEVIELRHSAQSREIFASGALRAARFLAAPGQRPGLYSMSDLVASVAE